MESNLLIMAPSSPIPRGRCPCRMLTLTVTALCPLRLIDCANYRWYVPALFRLIYPSVEISEHLRWASWSHYVTTARASRYSVVWINSATRSLQSRVSCADKHNVSFWKIVVACHQAFTASELKPKHNHKKPPDLL